MTIKVMLIPKANLMSIMPLIQGLNPSLSKTTLTTRLEEMISQGYQCAGLCLDDNLIGICGLWMMTKFYVGKHIEPDNVYILPEFRGQGYGKQLLNWLVEYGKSQGCIASELNCYISNEVGNAFFGTRRL
jgi:GNAT superfamily N-acetyltransferase